MPILTLILSFLFMMPLASAEKSLKDTIAVPGAQGAVAFDDLIFSGKLKKVIVPAGDTEQILLIDPSTQAITPVGILKPNKIEPGTPWGGMTSADEGDGRLFTIDRTERTVKAWDPSNNKMIASAPLASGPDYVRYVALTREVWVTEPDKARIEIFDFSNDALKHSGFIEIPGGPENLIIDQSRQRVYTHLWRQMTVVIDIKGRQVIEQWPNSCLGSHGLAFDEKRGFLFAGCSEGKLVVLDVNHHGKALGILETGWPGIDVMGYNAGLSHVYLAAGQSAKLSIVDISDKGIPDLLGVKDIAKGSHCVTGDDADGIWVCDPDRGRILYFKDDF